MANEKIIFDTEVKVGSSVGSVKSLKAELRAITNELGTLEAGSEAFVKAAKKAGELQDKIGDVKNTINAFNPEAKFQALAGAVGIAANGFAAMQGAMSLMGAESENLNKVIAQTQGAIALATGLNGLLGMGDAFNLLAIQIRTNVVAAFASLKSALVTTGIGALVIALGVLINEIFKYNDAVDAEVNAQKKFNEEQEKTLKLLEETATKTEKLRNARKGGVDEISREIKLLEASGASAEKISEKKIQLLEKELYNLQVRKYTGLNVDKEIADKQVEIQAAQLSQELSIQDKHDKEVEQRRKAKYQAENEKLKDAQILKNKEQDNIAKQIDDERQKQNEQDQKDLDRKRALAAQDILVKQEQYAQEQADLKADAEAKKNIDLAAAEAKKQLLQTSASILGSLSELAGKQTAEGKTLAIAQATIDTYLSASSAYATAAKIDPLVLAPLAAGAAIVAGFARVKAIAEVQVPGASGSGGGGAVAAPSAPRIPQSFSGSSLRPNSEVITKTNGQVQKVIVTETDITKTQDKVKGIIRKATIK